MHFLPVFRLTVQTTQLNVTVTSPAVRYQITGQKALYPPPGNECSLHFPPFYKN